MHVELFQLIVHTVASHNLSSHHTTHIGGVGRQCSSPAEYMICMHKIWVQSGAEGGGEKNGSKEGELRALHVRALHSSL